MSPASSTTSLPVSPLTEEPLPFKVKDTHTKIIVYNTFKITNKYLLYYGKTVSSCTDGKMNCFNM